MLPGDPNGLNWHEPRCPDCGRYDANCKCDWPMPKPPPHSADDEALEVPTDA